MQLIDGAPVYAATDLVGFLACEHLTALERAALSGLVERPNRLDPELEIIRRRGREHEARYLAERRDEGRSVVTINPDGYDAEAGERLRLAAAATERAMSDAADVIYQATFFDGRWRGHADFLLGELTLPMTPPLDGAAADLAKSWPDVAPRLRSAIRMPRPCGRALIRIALAATAPQSPRPDSLEAVRCRRSARGSAPCRSPGAPASSGRIACRGTVDEDARSLRGLSSGTRWPAEANWL